MVRGFFQRNEQRINDILLDCIPIFDRWHGWDLVNSIEPMDFDDFCLLADTVKEINKAEERSRRKT